MQDQPPVAKDDIKENVSGAPATEVCTNYTAHIVCLACEMMFFYRYSCEFAGVTLFYLVFVKLCTVTML